MRERTHRDHLNVNIPARDARTGQSLGHVTDLSIGGISLSGAGDQPEPAPEQIILKLPWPIHDQNELRMEVQRRWHEYSDDGRWHAGFKFNGCNDDQLVVLEQLVSRFAGE